MESGQFEQPTISSMLRYFHLPMMNAFCNECGECLTMERTACGKCMRLFHLRCMGPICVEEEPICTNCSQHSLCVVCERTFSPDEKRSICSICHLRTHFHCRQLPDLAHPDNQSLAHFSHENIACLSCFRKYDILKSLATVSPMHILTCEIGTSPIQKFWLVELAHPAPGHYTWITHQQWLAASRRENAAERLEPSIRHIISVFIPVVHAELKVSDVLEREQDVWDHLMWMVDWGDSQQTLIWEQNWRVVRFKGETRAFLHRLRMNWIECTFRAKKEKAMKSKEMKAMAMERLENGQAQRSLMKKYYDFYRERFVSGKEEAGNILLYKLASGVKMKARMVLKSTQQHLQKEVPQVIAQLARKVYSQSEIPSGMVILLDDSQCEKWVEVLRRNLPGMSYLLLQDTSILRKLIYYQLRCPLNSTRRVLGCDILLISSSALEAVCQIIALEDIINSSSLLVLSHVSTPLSRRFIHMTSISILKLKIVAGKMGGVMPLQVQEVSTFSSGSMQSSSVMPKLQTGDEDTIDSQLWRETLKLFTNYQPALMSTLPEKKERVIVLREMLAFGMGTKGESLIDAAMQQERHTYNKPDRNYLRKSITEFVAVLVSGLKQILRKRPLSTEEAALLQLLTFGINPKGIIKRVTNLYRLRKFYPLFASQPDKLALEPSRNEEWGAEMDLILARQVLQWGYGRWEDIGLSQFDFLNTGHPLTLRTYCISIGIAYSQLKAFFQARMDSFFTFLAAIVPQNE